MTKKIIAMILLCLFFTNCNHFNNKTITKTDVQTTIDTMLNIFGNAWQENIERGVNQVALFWEKTDGNKNDFKQFCINNFIADSTQKHLLFERLCENFESIYGLNNKMMVNLLRPLHVTNYPSLPIDNLFGAWNPAAHLEDDFYANKIAFHIMLNFPFYTLEEKNTLGKTWSNTQWGYARLGDIFTTRIPAQELQNIATAINNADNYISNYNIYMGNLIDNNGVSHFPKDMLLISHWGLRDELKSQYANKENGIQKQQLIYEVMKRIIRQEIPQNVINSNDCQWNPYKNTCSKNGQEINFSAEPSTRYQHLLECFLAMKAVDKYSPLYPTYISRTFEQDLEISQEELENIFVTFLSSPEVAMVGELIKQRLGRNLQAFDIWYDGFKERSNINPALLDQLTTKKYPNKSAFVADLPIIMQKLGFTSDLANFVCSHITVDASVGAGHAWEAKTKDDNARLRTRIGENGMDYKGYNIGIHEFGHNVEQTITLHNVPNYMLAGVPNTAFTEALAFIFQKRDMELLGMPSKDTLSQYYTTLDIFWGCYEIMGVALLDMRVWKWMYENPDCDAKLLQNAVIDLATNIWNEFYAPIFGIKNEPILAIYSHMIDAPLYLSAYPIGHIIEFQLENYLSNKIIGEEVPDIFANGRLTPQIWLSKGLNTQLSINPLLEETNKAVTIIKNKNTKQD